MTLIGKDRSLVGRALVGVRAAIVPRHAPQLRSYPLLVLSHRGVVRQAPENTVQAFRAAIDGGADGVETDVCVTRDGHVVLWHDRDPDDAISRARRRGADGTGFVPYVPPDRKLLPITELSLEDFREHYGYARWGVPRVTGEPERVACVESFEDFLRWFADEPRARVAVIDVKLAPHELAAVPALVRALERALSEHPGLMDRRLHLLCREREVYFEIGRELGRRALPAWNLTADFELPGVLATARELGARHVALGVTLRRFWSAVRHETIDVVRARCRGELESVMVWTVEDVPQLSDLDEIGVDLVIVSDDVLDHVGKARRAAAS
jgi:glycerophosphoryl diester phosphodiesterase